MTDIEKVSKFLRDFEEQGAHIYYEDNRFCACAGDIFANGSTVTEAIAQFYEATKKGKGKS